MRYIAVIGGSSCDSRTALAAEAVGAELARRGGVVICGGGGGVMEAAARGACSAGGMVIGVLPGKSRQRVNRYLTVALATGMGEARNAIIARSCDAVIAVGGEYGTLSEIALALKMGKPVIGLDTWRVEPPGGMIEQGIVEVETASAAVKTAWELTGSGASL